MADRRTKNVNYGTTSVISSKLTEYESSDYSKPDVFTVVLKKGATVVDTWVAGTDSEIVEVLDDGDFQYYNTYVDTTIFAEPCEAEISITATYYTTPTQNIVGKVRLIIT